MTEIVTVGVVGRAPWALELRTFSRVRASRCCFAMWTSASWIAPGPDSHQLGREAAKGRLAEAEVEPALARITTIADREALAAAEFAIEAARSAST